MALPYTQIQTEMLLDVGKQVWDSIYFSDQWTARMRSKAVMKAHYENEGVVRYDLPDLGGWYSSYTAFTLAQSSFLTKWKYTRKDLTELVLITDQDERNNQTAAKAVQIILERTRASADALADRINTQMWTAGTSTNTIASMVDILSETDPSAADLGGVDRDDATIGTMWKALVYGKNTQGYGDDTSVQLTPHKLRKAILNTEAIPGGSPSQRKPTVILCDRATFATMLLWPAGIQRITTEYRGQAQNYSYANMEFQGLPVMWTAAISNPFSSAASSTGWVAIINENFLGMQVQPGCDASAGPLIQVPGSTGKVAKIDWGGHIWCSNPRKQALIKDINPDE